MQAQDFGDIISKRRRELSLSQDAFAEKLRVSNKTVSRWETGKGFPDISVLPDICEVLNLSYYELFGLPKEEQTPETLEPIVRQVLLELKEQERKERIERIKKGLPYLFVGVAVLFMAVGIILFIALKEDKPQDSEFSSQEESEEPEESLTEVELANRYWKKGKYQEAYKLFNHLSLHKSADKVILSWQDDGFKAPLDEVLAVPYGWQFYNEDFYLEYLEKIEQFIASITYPSQKEQAEMDFWMQSLVELMPQTLSNKTNTLLYRFLRANKYYTEAGTVMTNWKVAEPEAEFLSQYLVVEQNVKADLQFTPKTEYEGQFYFFICQNNEDQKWLDENILGLNDCQEGYLYAKNMKTGVIMQLLASQADDFWLSGDEVIALCGKQFVAVDYTGTTLKNIYCATLDINPDVISVYQDEVYFNEGGWLVKIRYYAGGGKRVKPILYVGDEIMKLTIESSTQFTFTTKTEPEVIKKYDNAYGFITSSVSPIAVNDNTLNIWRDLIKSIWLDIDGDGEKEAFHILKSQGNLVQLVALETTAEIYASQIDEYCDKVYASMPTKVKNALIAQERDVVYYQKSEDLEHALFGYNFGRCPYGYNASVKTGSQSTKKVFCLGMEDFYEMFGGIGPVTPDAIYFPLAYGGAPQGPDEVIWTSSMSEHGAQLAFATYSPEEKHEVIEPTKASLRISFVIDLSQVDWSWNE